MRPVFADARTDLVFKRIFGDESHKDILIGLLDPLLGLDEAHRIVDLTYLSAEQAPRIPELKSSIVDVKCVDAQGTRYVVEMQVLNVEGFEKRIVYNLCKAYTTQLAAGDDYPVLNDVVAVTICDFELWAAADPPHVPMVSRWSMREEASGARRLQQLRYAFLELPKYRAGADPVSMVDRWAYFFRETSHLKSVPAPLSQAPFARALEVARSSGFTPEEWEAYDRAKVAEQDARGALGLERRLGRDEGRAEGRAEGRVEGLAEGRAAGIRQGLTMAIEDLCEVLGVDLTSDRRAWLASLDEPGLRALKTRLLRTRQWD
jgi:predicted transposase/invertase (TIGR01784 family)